MKPKETNVVGITVMETTDWSAETIAQNINKIQSSVDGKQLVFTGDTFEADGTEYQIVVLSRGKLNPDEMSALIQKQIKDLSS